MSVNSQNEEKLSYYAVSPAHGRGGSQDEVKLAYYALRLLPHPHTQVGGGRARREEVHAGRTSSRIFPNPTRAGTRWSSFLYEKAAHVVI